MADDNLDQLASNARSELRKSLEARPPDVRRFAQQARVRRRALTGVAAALVMVAVAVPLALRDGGEGTQVTTGPSPDGSNADLLRAGESRSLAPAPLAGRSTMAAVWTGRQMLIWGGDGPGGQFADGATYDPRSDSWTLLPASPLTARNAPAGVWTGDEVILWGGSSSSGDHRDGAAYNPTTRSWRSIAEAPFASAGRPVGLWTGSEMIVLAGFNSRDVAAYDPATDSWRPLPELPGQLQAPNPVGAWANDQVFAVIQSNGTSPAGSPRLVSLRPDSDGWSSDGDLPSGQAVLASTTDALLVAAHAESFTLVGGDRKEIAVAPDGVTVGDTPSVWTGTELVLWEGDTASVIDPAARTWQSIPAGDASRQTQPAVVWADGVLLAWGGFPDHAGGIMLRLPDAGPEQTTSSPPASSAQGATAVWDIDRDDPPNPASGSFTAMVTRLGCSGGETGEVLNPTVVTEEERIVVTFTVERLPDGAHDCPGNNQVPYVVQLNEPVGPRELVDGACLAGDALSTSFCEEGAARWSP